MDVKKINIKDVQVVENSRISVKDVSGLMKDIEQHGLRQAIGVMETKTNEYVLVFGHRRLVACEKLGNKTIDAHIYKEMDLQDLLLHNLGENLHREDTSPMELGRICDRLKKFGLNVSEIHAKLSIPASRINAALDCYYNLPDKYRKKVSYYGHSSKNGNISAAVAAKIVSVKRQYGLSDSATEKLLSTAKMEEFNHETISLIGQFLDQGTSVTEAIKMTERYRPARLDVIVDVEEMNALLAKYKMDSARMLLQHILYGEIPPLKKPSFVKIAQVPDKKKD